MSDKNQPMGIMASYTDITFKKDGKEVFTTTVSDGGCLGPDDDIEVINSGYRRLQKAIEDGTLPKAAKDFNAVSIGFGGREYAVNKKSDDAPIAESDITRVPPPRPPCF